MGTQTGQLNRESNATTPSTLSAWSLVQPLHIGPLFALDRARPRHCGPPWPADYVVKRVRPNATQPLVARRLLAREAQVSAAVTHPNLTTILAADLAAPQPYLVRPYYEGRSARQLLEQAPCLRIRTALWIARQTAQALESLHQQGWLHGDVKADNLVVSETGHVTLIDLGFSCRWAADELPIQAPLQTSLHYAAPESLTNSLSMSPATDMYSLGVLLYELLTNRLPFYGADPADVARQHVEQPAADPRVHMPHLPAHLARLVLRLLSKLPGHRPTASELIEKLYYYEIEAFAA